MKECSVSIYYEDEDGFLVTSKNVEFQIIQDGCVKAMASLPGADKIEMDQSRTTVDTVGIEISDYTG